jgi:hypothetical protein
MQERRNTLAQQMKLVSENAQGAYCTQQLLSGWFPQRNRRRPNVRRPDRRRYRTALRHRGSVTRPSYRRSETW